MSVFELFEITSVFMFVTQDYCVALLATEKHESIQLTWPKVCFLDERKPVQR